MVVMCAISFFVLFSKTITLWAFFVVFARDGCVTVYKWIYEWNVCGCGCEDFTQIIVHDEWKWEKVVWNIFASLLHRGESLFPFLPSTRLHSWTIFLCEIRTMNVYTYSNVFVPCGYHHLAYISAYPEGFLSQDFYHHFLQKTLRIIIYREIHTL